jgi:hypothetical protein
MSENNRKPVEVRGFLQLDQLFKQRNWPVPLFVDIEKPLTGIELAEKLAIPLAEIEIIFINGFAQSVQCVIQSGDRVAFVPPGCPGPYRMALGFYAKNQENQYSFALKDKDKE